MLSLSFNPESLFFHAEAAYQTRPIAATKRQLINNIKVSCVEIGSPERKDVEQFIHDVFADSYDANVQQFMPQLISLRDENQQLVAAFGMRKADQEPLFLERYLDEPIEVVISSRFNRVITRHEITEIGNLAVANPRNAGVLIAHVIKHSLDVKVAWCVATAHHTLQNGLIKGGRDVYALQSANKARLTGIEQATWGRYYDQLSQVVAIRGVAEL